MNIFILDVNPVTSVEYYVDKHVVKMPTETAQLLSSAHHILDGDKCPPDIYKLTHKNHPCSIWTRETSENYRWLFEYFKIQLSEYTYRYGKVHACTRLVELLKPLPKNIKIGSITPKAQCMPDQYKVDGDVIQAYRNYYMGEKRHIANWKLRNTPFWYI